ncbi:unnamed protein product, partial [Prunus brigantina]
WRLGTSPPQPPNPSVSSNPHTSSQNPTQLSSSHLRIFATKNQHFIIGLEGSSVSLSMSSWRTKKQSTHLENCTEKAQEAADSQIPIVIPSVRVAEKLSRKKSERFAYLVAAVMSSFGITSMPVRLFITDFTGKWRVGMCLCLKCWVHLLYLLVLLWEWSFASRFASNFATFCYLFDANKILSLKFCFFSFTGKPAMKET